MASFCSRLSESTLLIGITSLENSDGFSSSTLQDVLKRYGIIRVMLDEKHSRR